MGNNNGMAGFFSGEEVMVDGYGGRWSMVVR